MNELESYQAVSIHENLYLLSVEQSFADSSVSETDESFEDAVDKSNPVTSTTDGLSESILKLDISK